MHPRRRAFSLLELMLVLAIIGVLMAVAAWNIVGTGDRAKIKATRVSMGVIENALKAYYTDPAYSAYPPTIHTLASVRPPFLEANRLKDAWGRDFYYRLTGSPDRPYDLISLGPDGKPGTEDDLNIWDQNRP